ncbi:MAG TPA: alpha/beta hydrolase [Thermoleophilaceae bacterium]|nr:alpha/beta hydrolase [Thermoleophilaceae bacterium]
MPRPSRIRRWPLLCLALGLCLAGVPSAASAAYTPHLNLSYDIDSPPAPSPARHNQLDLYTPTGARQGSRPVVAYVHGGGWQVGDKRNKILRKVNLFTGQGYVFASLNYRLSPTAPPTGAFDPNRVRFPDHPHDVGEAIGWLRRNVARYGGDPSRIVLIGHSAGAHLVSLVGTDPRYVQAYGVRSRNLLGVVSLDTAYDITPLANPQREGSRGTWSVFGTPEENAATGSWRAASPLFWADPSDPPFLVVGRQAAPRRRQNEARRFVTALGLGSGSLLAVPLTHAGINDSLGSPTDPTLETDTVTAFVRGAVVSARPKATIRRHPKRRVRADGARARVTFSFRADRTYLRFQCRRDRTRFKSCRSPFRWRARPGRHTFQVRALDPAGGPGPADRFRFRVRRA